MSERLREQLEEVAREFALAASKCERPDVASIGRITIQFADPHPDTGEKVRDSVDEMAKAFLRVIEESVAELEEEIEKAEVSEFDPPMLQHFHMLKGTEAPNGTAIVVHVNLDPPWPDSEA